MPCPIGSSLFGACNAHGHTNSMFHANIGEKAGRRFIYGFRQGDHHGGAWKNQEVQRTGQIVPNEPMRAAPQPARVAAVLCTRALPMDLEVDPADRGHSFFFCAGHLVREPQV